jgi:geranylgeranyl pyrophosphate synthase
MPVVLHATAGLSGDRTPELDALDEAASTASLARVLGLPIALPPALWLRVLFGPAEDFLARPGKRFRAALVTAAWRLAGRRASPPPLLATVVEVLHAGSLIVDDIEDGARERRGAPALHRVVGTPLALNTGNWMYCWPGLLISQARLSPELELAIHRDLQQTLVRCHHGQALDLGLRIGAVERTEVPAIVAAIGRLKTGALLELAARLGARAAGADDALVDALGAFGVALGEGLQMLDDLGSIASPARAAKAEEDLGQLRCTWPWAWLAESTTDAEWARWMGRAAEAPVAELARELNAAVGDAGRARAHAHLEDALDALGGVAGAAPTMEYLRAEVLRVEASYG